MSSLPPDEGAAPPADSPDPEQPRTASGLDETELDPRDMDELRGQFRFTRAEHESSAGVATLAGWELPPALDKSQLAITALAIPSVRAERMRMAPLPGKVRTATVRIDQPRVRMQRDLALALAMPIRRPRVAAGELTRAEQDAVNSAVVKKYGSAARNLTLAGVFREVPPEAAKSVRLDEALRFCQFTLPPGTNVARLQSGYALVIATGDSGKTYPALARL